MASQLAITLNNILINLNKLNFPPKMLSYLFGPQYTLLIKNNVIKAGDIYVLANKSL